MSARACCNSGELRFRPLAKVDIPAVAAIENDALSSWNHHFIEHEMMVQGGVQYVAENKNGIIGWYAVRQIPPEAELQKIGVRKEHRRRGAGSCLLAHLIRQMTGLGNESLFLEVRSKNVPALCLYQKHGFVEIGRRPGYYSKPEDDALILRRNLR